jgi:hypothetical protein
MLRFAPIVMLLIAVILGGPAAQHDRTRYSVDHPEQSFRGRGVRPHVKHGAPVITQAEQRSNLNRLAMLKAANLTGKTDPGLEYQKFDEVLNSSIAERWHGSSVFRDFAALLESPEVTQYNSDATRPKIINVAFFKTHKTGSSTLASVLYRFAARHRLKIFQGITNGPILPAQVFNYFDTRPNYFRKDSFNIVFQHLSGRGIDFTGNMTKILQFYDHILKEPLKMSILRDPISQTLSWICYYFIPQNLQAVEYFLEHGIEGNIQCAEFGIKNIAQLEAFLQDEYNVFRLMCLSDRFDECMVMMRRKMNWDMLDITHLAVNDGGLYQ